MNRAFRAPILPALQGAARARFSSATTTQSNNTNQTSAPPHLARKAGADAQPQYFIGEASKKNVNDKMKFELLRIKNRLELKLSFKDVQNLVHVHAMMSIYRRYRDAACSVNASEPIHAILMILRLRTKVLKPVISKVRRQIMGTQNRVLSEYLNEIADDLATGRSYASRFAITYLLTAFSTMDEHAQAAQVWRKLNESSTKAAADPAEANEESQSLFDKLQDPRVVSAALRSSDPSAVTLEDFEKTYWDTTNRNGRYILADEALAIGYLRFKEYHKAVKMYTSMCDYYDVDRWTASLVRLHNNILTQCPDADISNVFFEAAVSEDSFLYLHPSAAASYVTHLYNNTGDINRVVDTYERAMHCLKTQQKDFGQANFMNVTAECLKCIIQREFALLGPTDEARALIERVYKGEDQVVLNAVLSMVSKTWTCPEYIAYLQQQFPPTAELQFDAVRILLNSTQQLSIEQCSLQRVDELWQRLLSLKQPQIFDWLSLAKACDNADRTAYLVEKVAQGVPEQGLSSFAGRLDHAPLAKAALVEANLLNEPTSHRAFSTSDVDSELAARSQGSETPQDSLELDASDAESRSEPSTVEASDSEASSEPELKSMRKESA